MTTLALLIRQPKRVRIAFSDQLLEDAFQVDFLEAEQHAWDVAITRHPVEKGANIVDHIQPQPRRAIITGAVTDIPMNLVQFASAINPFSESKTETLMNLLKELYASKKLVTLATKHQTYQNMACTGISFERNTQSGSRLSYQVTFEEIQLVASLSVPNKSAAKDLTGAPKSKGAGSATQDIGKKPPVSPPVDPLANATTAAKWFGVGGT